ncbi:MAG: tail fiber protein, partial [Bacteroidaceae bacterium]|nr:tail fiber protein [Bacteroidaceae bacterium]
MKKQIHFGNKSSKSNLDFKKLNELQERLQGTSENSNPVTDPFKFLGEFDSYDELNATLDTLTYSLGYQKGYGYFRARVEDRAIDVKNILMSSDLNVVGQVVQGMLSLDGNKKLSPAYSTYRIYFRKHQNDVWGEWKEYAGASSGGSSSGGGVDLSDYATIEELDEATNYLAQYINTVESKIPDVRINNESIVNESKIVNLEEHFKTINGNSILVSGNDDSLKCVEKVLIDGDIQLNPEDGVLDLRGLLGDSSSGSGSVDLSDYVKKTDEGVQHILGGLVVGSDETPSAAQKGRIMLTGVENPLIGVQSGTTPYYVQAHENKMYVGPVRGKAMMLDSSGNVTMSAALSVTGDISEGGETLSKKYTTKGELTTTELYFVDYVKDKVKDRVKAIIVNGGDPITPNSEGVLDLGYIEGGSSGDGDGGEVAVADVTVDGASVVVNKVAQIALASTTKKGVVQLSDRYDSNSSDYAASSSAVYGVYNLLGDKVDKVEGKDLSTNDYTDDDKEKLDSIEESANNYTHPSEGEMAAGSYAAYNPSSFFDENSDVLQIPTLTVNKYGHVTSAGVNYVELPKFKTINNQTIVGEGNITIAGGDGGSVDLSDYVKEVKINNAAQTPDEDGVVALGITINGNSGTVSGSDSATLMFNNITQAIKIDSDATPIYCGIDGTLHLNGVLATTERVDALESEFEEATNDLVEHINTVETKIPDVRINNESIVNESKIVNLDGHFKTINGNSILVSGNDDSLKCVEKVLIDGDIQLNPEDGVLDLRGLLGGSSSGGGSVDLSGYATREELEEATNDLVEHINTVETKIPDVRINNESIVNESKIVNLDGHFKTINGNSILVSGND